MIIFVDFIKRAKRVFMCRIWMRVCPNHYAYRMYKNAHKTHIKFYGGYDGRDMASYIEDSLKVFLSPIQLSESALVKRIIIDIVQSYLRYGTNPTEYFCYGFFNKGKLEREQYLSREQKDMLLISQMGNCWKTSFDFIKDKNQFYQKMKRFFHREACPIECINDKKFFVDLLSKHRRLIVKPNRGGCGSGIEIISLVDNGENAEQIFDRLLLSGCYIAEEIVEQDPRISKWNESSLNTVRIPVFRTRKGVKFFYPTIRMGRADSIVDNAAAGGIFAAIDSETGILISDGFDKCGKQFFTHPDSHIRFKGAEIPDWDILKALVADVQNAMPPEHKYVAYDMALSTYGWMVVEANWGEISMPQIEFGRGLKQEFLYMLNS